MTLKLDMLTLQRRRLWNDGWSGLGLQVIIIVLLFSRSMQLRVAYHLLVTLDIGCAMYRRDVQESIPC